MQASRNGHSHDKVWRSNEGVSGRVGIVTASKVSVVGRDDGVRLALLDILTVPLANAVGEISMEKYNGGTGSISVHLPRSTGVCQNHASELLESLKLTVTLDCGANLLRTWGNSEERLGLHAVVQCIPGDRSSARHILV